MTGASIVRGALAARGPTDREEEKRATGASKRSPAKGGEYCTMLTPMRTLFHAAMRHATVLRRQAACSI